MAKYRAYYRTTASAFVDVEAEDEDGAMEAADREWSAPTLCWQCSRSVDLADWEPEEGKYAIVPLDENGRPAS